MRRSPTNNPIEVEEELEALLRAFEPRRIGEVQLPAFDFDEWAEHEDNQKF